MVRRLLGRLAPDAGAALDAPTWERRHRLLLAVMWAQVAALATWDALGGALSPWWVAVMAAAVLAGESRLGRGGRSCAAAAALLAESTAVTILAGGEAAHLHLLVTLVLLAAYEDDRPFLAGFGFLVGHSALFEHGLGAALLHSAPLLVAGAGLRFVRQGGEAVRRRERALRTEAEELLRLAGVLIVRLDTDGRIRTANRKTCEVLGRREEDVIGRDWVEIALPRAVHERARRHLARLRGGDLWGTEEVEGTMLALDGPRRIRWHNTVLRAPDGTVTGTLHSGLDVTDRRDAERRMTREGRELGELRRMAREIAATDDARQAVVDGVARLTGASYVSLAEPSEDGTELVHTVTHGLPALVGQRIALGREPSGAAAAYLAREPIFVPDMASSPIASPRLRRVIPSASALFHPIVVGDEVLGVLMAAWREPVLSLSHRGATLVGVAADEAALALGRLASLRRLEAAAHTDVLTGIANRRRWDEELPVALERSRRSGSPLAVALLDLNGFKALNDREGHAAGDRVLQDVAARWQGCLRAGDLLARLGGDEFGVLLPDCGERDAPAAADRLRRAVPAGVSAGVGIAVWDGSEDVASLLRRADAALYQDKRGEHVVALRAV